MEVGDEDGLVQYPPRLPLSIKQVWAAFVDVTIGELGGILLFASLLERK